MGDHLSRARRTTARGAAAALLLAACGYPGTGSWLQLPDYPTPVPVTAGASVMVPIGPAGERVALLVIALEGRDGGPVPPPLAALIEPIVGGECRTTALAADPPTVVVKAICPDLRYMRAIVTAAPTAAAADVPLRLRVDYLDLGAGVTRRAVAPLTVSIR